MKIKLAVYNMKWMCKLFKSDGTPKVGNKQSEDLAKVVQQIDPDILCIVEGPDTLKSGTKTASSQLEEWRKMYNLCDDYRGVHGFPSGGRQELCALYKKSKIRCVHAPEKSNSKNPFNKEFLVDTTNNLIKECYKHYRPPFEISVQSTQEESKNLMRIIVAHTKSKYISGAVDLAHFEQLSERNRHKLYAECYSIRERCNQWLEANPDLKLAVVGDINDGFGLDYYEQRFSRSAVEILLGDVWMPEHILKSVLPRPKLNKSGWDPSSSKFKDTFTEKWVNVLIDHILVSQNVEFQKGLVWNPYLKNAPDEVKQIRTALKNASDHYPVSVEITL